MKELLDNKKLSILAVLSIGFILTFSSFVFPAKAAAAGVDWGGVMGNAPLNWDYASQTQLSPSNVQNLQVKWIYPVPSPPAGSTTSGTAITSPLLVGGVSYVITEYNNLIAQNSANGQVLWQRLLCCGKLPDTGHYHGFAYTSSMKGNFFNKPIVWVESGNGTLWGINALTGDIVLNWNQASAMYGLTITGPGSVDGKVPGNFGQYSVGSTGSKLLFDTARGILITGSAGSEGTNAGRGFFEGFDMTQNPPVMLWRSFMIPPQDGSDPNWALKSVANMTHAYIFNGTGAVDLKALSQSQQNTLLYKDWGTFGFNGTRSYAGGNAGWGGAWALDANSGTAYVATAQGGPDFNATTRPGPNLWTASVLALNDQTGAFTWAFQSTAHDMWDMDCSFGVILANATIAGRTQETVFKGCKSGYEYALNAQTGAMSWYFAGSTFRNQYSKVPNPLNQTEMTRPWSNYPSTKAYPNTHWGIESNPSYDPTSNMLFVVTNNVPLNYIITPTTGPNSKYGSNGAQPYVYLGGNNMTIWGLDAGTGKPKWSYFLNNGLRGGYTSTNGLLFVPLNDGNMDIFDSNSGKLLRNVFIGTQLITEPAIGTDTNGNVVVVEPAGGSGAVPQALTYTSSFVFALGLGGLGVATGSTATVTTTAPGTTVTTTAAGTGVDQTTFYAVVAIAAIFVIATGALVLTRRRPAR